MAAVNCSIPRRSRGWRRAPLGGEHAVLTAQPKPWMWRPNRVIAGDLIRGGHANVLIGQPEGHWLKVKRQHHVELRCRQDQAS